MSVQLSIVVPTYRRPDRLAACLAALAALERPPGGFEVVVVDDGSPEPMEPVAARFGDAVDLTVHRQANAGPAAARNAGAEVARGEFLAFTDDDCAPRPGWLARLADRLAAQPDAMVGGTTVNAVPDNAFSEASQALVSYICAYYSEPGRGSFLASNNMALPTAAFRDVGGFDTSYPRPGGEDRELCDRWLASGRDIVLVPEAVLDHHHHLDARSFWRQHVNYGRGAYRFHRQRAARDDEGMRVEPLRFYTGLLRYPFREASGARAAVTAGLLGAAQVANVAGFVAERFSRSG